MNKQHKSFATKERGAVLMGGVILLTLMTLIGLTSIKNATLEEKMAGNNREKYRSFEISEMTLSIADGHLVRQDDVLPFYAGTYSGSGAPTIDGLYDIATVTDKCPASAKSNKKCQPWQYHGNWDDDIKPHNNSPTALRLTPLAVNNADVPDSIRISSDELVQLNIAAPPRYMMGLDGEVPLDGMDSSIPQKFFRFYLTGQARGGIETIKTTLQTEALRAY